MSSVNDCNLICGKWAISFDEENYSGFFDSEEEAIEEGKFRDSGPFYVGQCVSPPQPETLFRGDAVDDWLNRHVWGHDDYSHDFAAGQVCPTTAQMDELADEIRPLISKWLDRHKLRPTFFIIDPGSVSRIEV